MTNNTIQLLPNSYQLTIYQQLLTSSYFIDRTPTSYRHHRHHRTDIVPYRPSYLVSLPCQVFTNIPTTVPSNIVIVDNRPDAKRRNNSVNNNNSQTASKPTDNSLTSNSQTTKQLTKRPARLPDVTLPTAACRQTNRPASQPAPTTANQPNQSNSCLLTTTTNSCSIYLFFIYLCQTPARRNNNNRQIVRQETRQLDNNSLSVIRTDNNNNSLSTSGRHQLVSTDTNRPTVVVDLVPTVQPSSVPYRQPYRRTIVIIVVVPSSDSCQTLSSS